GAVGDRRRADAVDGAAGAKVLSIKREGAAGHDHGAGVVNAATAASAIVGQGAAGQVQCAVIGDAAAVVACAAVGDCAVAERQRAVVADAGSYIIDSVVGYRQAADDNRLAGVYLEHALALAPWVAEVVVGGQG